MDQTKNEAAPQHTGQDGDRPVMFRVKATLEGSSPAMWRLLDIDSSVALDTVHLILQCAVGWRQSHLHLFTDTDPEQGRLNGRGPAPRQWGPPAVFEDDEDCGRNLPEAQATLEQVLGAGVGPLFYEYDFGDGWTHRLELVDTRPGSLDEPRARLISGARRAPLEDSGGPAGYARLLEVLADPGQEEFSDAAAWVEWVAGPWQSFDPDALDISAVNEELAALCPPASGTSADESPSPARELTDRIHAGLRTEFRSHLAGALDGPTAVAPDTAEAMTAPYLWLIRRIGSGGLALTAAGWLPPAVVHEAMNDLGWAKDWPGQAKREDSTPPVLRLRESSHRLGLIRRLKGRLVLTAAAKRLLDDPAGLWLFLARAATVRKLHDVERDAVLLFLIEIAAGKRAARTGYAAAVAFGLEALGWRGADGDAPPEEFVDEILRGPGELFLRLGVFDGVRSWSEAAVTEPGRAFARAALLA